MTWLAQLSCAPSNATPASVFASHQITATGNQTLDGSLVSAGVATFGAAQLVTFTADAGDNCSAVTFTVTGTDPDGRAQTEAIVGPNNNTVTGTKYFKTVTAVSASATTGAGVQCSCGNAVTSVSRTLRTNLHHPNFAIGMGALVTGTITYSVQHTFQDYPGGDPTRVTYPTNWFEHATITGDTTSVDGSYLYPVAALRLRVTASTSGSVVLDVAHSGM